MSKKKQTLSALFQSCKNEGVFDFDNEKVKAICQQTEFKNPFDVTKIDNSDLLPDDMREESYCVVHLGGGRHRFMPIANIWYHSFEKINEDEKIKWPYTPSILNHTDTSESNVISFTYNQGIIQDFLYGERSIRPKIYMSRRTNITTSYFIGNSSIDVKELQVEMDATFEHEGKVAALEAKNGFPVDFAVYQIYHPYLSYHQRSIEGVIRGVNEIVGCYLLRDREQHCIRLYLYTFPCPDDMMSIRLVKKAEYILKGEK